MPSMESSDLTFDVVLWAASTSVAADGTRKIGTPEEIKARWELSGGWGSSVRRGIHDIRDSKGNTVSIDAILFTADDMVEGSIVYLGSLEEFYGTGSAGDRTNLYEIVSFSKIPDDKGREFRRVSILKRHRDSLPTIAS